MKIGDLARATQTPVQTIRHYEHEGLLPKPVRSEGNYRQFGPEHVARLNFVRHCRALDMGLGDVRALLRVWDDPQAACGEVNALLDAHLGQVGARIHALHLLQQQLVDLRARCAGQADAAHCGILAGLAQPINGSGGA